MYNIKYSPLLADSRVCNDIPFTDKQTFNLTVQNAVVMAPSGTERTWTEWTGDHIQAGLGAAIQSLVSGILIGLGQVLIQSVADMVRGDNVKDEKPDLEYQNLKIAAINADCETLLDSQGKVQQAVLKLLDRTQKEEPNNYPAYISGVAKCRSERMQRKDL